MRWKESFDLICGWNRFLIIIKDVIYCHQYFLGAFLEKAEAPEKSEVTHLNPFCIFFFLVICMKQNSKKIRNVHVKLMLLSAPVTLPHIAKQNPISQCRGRGGVGLDVLKLPYRISSEVTLWWGGDLKYSVWLQWHLLACSKELVTSLTEIFFLSGIHTILSLSSLVVCTLC